MEKHWPDGNNSGNSRNASFPKKIQTEHGESIIQIPETAEVILNLSQFQNTRVEVCLLNTNITSLQGLIAALESNDQVTSVSELADKSGYIISFAKIPAVTIKHGADGADGTDGTSP